MSQYHALVALSGLNGRNGFRIDGGAAWDRIGNSVASAGDVNGDGFDDVILGSWGTDVVGDLSGSAYVVFGGPKGFDPALTVTALDGANGFRIAGVDAFNKHGVPISGASTVASAGDVNGDGIGDVIVGAWRHNPHGYYSGSSYVVFGQTDGFGATLDPAGLDGNNGFRLDGGAFRDYSGRTVSSAGDFNGDGFGDLLVGAYRADPNGGYSGSSYVIFGAADGSFAPSLDLTSLDGANGFRLDGTQPYDKSGRSVSSAGDVNGDGLDDLLIGAYMADHAGDQSGSSYIVFGSGAPMAAAFALSAVDGNNGFRIDGAAEGDRSGFSVAAAGDVNADGFGDFIVGAYRADPNGDMSGTSYVVFGGPAMPGAVGLDTLNGSDGFRIDGGAELDFSGFSVAGAGDFNGDGFADVLIGAYRADPNGTYSGAAYVVFGAAAGFDSSLDVSALDGNNGFRIEGSLERDFAGRSVAAAGDVNGDGFGDLVIGADGADANGGYSGSSYVIFGGKPGEAVARTGTAIGNTIHGGNLDDTLAGRQGHDTLIAYRGADTLLGGAGGDTLVGGDGEDVLNGGGGGDRIAGGRDADRFVYEDAAESTGVAFDTIQGADFNNDLFDLDGAVGGIDGAIAGGALSSASFDADLGAAAGAAQLAATHAVLFAPDAGTLAGSVFLIVDRNGSAGYQAGADVVIRLRAPLAVESLDASDFV